MREERTRGGHDIATSYVERLVRDDDRGRFIVEPQIHAPHPRVDHVLAFAGGLHEQRYLQSETQAINLFGLLLSLHPMAHRARVLDVADSGDERGAEDIDEFPNDLTRS